MNMIVADITDAMNTFWGQMIYDICGLGLNKVTGWVSDLVDYDSMWDMLSGFTDSIKVVASVWLLIHFLCFILEQATREQMTMDVFFKGFLKFIIGFFFVQNCIPIFNLLMQLGDIMQTELSPSKLLSSIDPETGEFIGAVKIEDIKTALSNNQFPTMDTSLAAIGQTIVDLFQWIFDILIGMGTTILFWLIALVVNVVIALMLFVRIMELAIRALFAPIAVVDVFEHGTGGNGFKYMKKFFAVAIQGAVIMAIMSIILSISSYTINDAEQLINETALISEQMELWPTIILGFLKNSALKIAGLGLIMKSQPICNDVIGV